MKGSGLMVELQASMKYEGHVNTQIETSVIGAFP